MPVRKGPMTAPMRELMVDWVPMATPVARAASTPKRMVDFMRTLDLQINFEF
jgi:hypothetical protein